METFQNLLTIDQKRELKIETKNASKRQLDQRTLHSPKATYMSSKQREKSCARKSALDDLLAMNFYTNIIYILA